MSTTACGLKVKMLLFVGILLFAHCTVSARAAVCSAGDRAALLQFKSGIFSNCYLLIFNPPATESR